MRKTLKAIFFALLFSNFIYAKTIQVTSPGNGKDIQPAIQTAVNGAVNGDIIVLPAGQFVVNKSVVITKFISIKGQGIGITTLYRSETTPDATLSNDGSWRAILRYTINSRTPSGIVVSDLTLKSKKPSMVDGDGLSLASDIGLQMTKCVDFIITRCRFENFGYAGLSIQHEDDLASGLVYKNEFVHNAKGPLALGLGYGIAVYGVNDKWINDPKFGSGNFIFIEDNMFDYHRHSVAGGGCALYVFRNNDVRNNIAGGTRHAIDAHEARLEAGGNYYSSRAIEVYNNKIVNTMFTDNTKNCPNGTPITAGKSPKWLTECAIRTRGGEAVIHDNYIEGYRFGVGLMANGVLSDPYPIPYQQGYLSAQKYGSSHTGVDGDKASGDVFIWNDTYKSYDPANSQCVYFYNYSTSYLVKERDYHLFAKADYKIYPYPHPLRKETTTSPLTITASNKNLTCYGANDGSATVAATGGTGAYTYNWSSNPVQTTATAGNLAAGTYTVTVKDAAGTTKTATVTITQPTVMTVTSPTTTENCGKKDGTATATVTGGTAPYTYTWTTTPVQTAITATGLTAGGYTVTATDKNGCSASVKATVTKTTALSATTALTPENCRKKDGTATVTVTGGSAPYTYAWTTTPVVQTSNKATGLTAGGYTVNITDKVGCTLAVPVVIKRTSTPAAAITSKDVSCSSENSGSAAVVVTDGVAPYTYEWNTVPAQKTATAINLQPGEYEVTVTDAAGCYTKIGAVINKAKVDFTLSTVKTDVSCANCNDGTASVIVSGKPATYNYTWSAINNPVLTTAKSATGLTAGNYTVTVADENGCKQQATTQIASAITTGIEVTTGERSDITLFPNPAQSKFNISNGDFQQHESILVVLYNTAGVEVYSKILVKEDNVIAVDTENKLEPGIYVVVASSQDRMYKKKIIITQ